MKTCKKYAKNAPLGGIPQKMNHTTLMPWGKHKATKMADVPADYLLWCYFQRKCCKRVKQYIEDNFQTLKKDDRK